MLCLAVDNDIRHRPDRDRLGCTPRPTGLSSLLHSPTPTLVHHGSQWASRPLSASQCTACHGAMAPRHIGSPSGFLDQATTDQAGGCCPSCSPASVSCSSLVSHDRTYRGPWGRRTVKPAALRSGMLCLLAGCYSLAGHSAPWSGFPALRPRHGPLQMAHLDFKTTTAPLEDL